MDLESTLHVLTPLLTGPTAGLATVLLMLGGAGVLTYYGFLPVLSRSWERQNAALESTTAAMRGVQSALEALAHETSQRLGAIEADVERTNTELRDHKAASEATAKEMAKALKAMNTDLERLLPRRVS